MRRVLKIKRQLLQFFATVVLKGGNSGFVGILLANINHPYHRVDLEGLIPCTL